MSCHYCGTDTGLRPFGPDGADVCYSCATANEDRMADIAAGISREIGKVINGEESGVQVRAFIVGPDGIKPLGENLDKLPEVLPDTEMIKRAVAKTNGRFDPWRVP